MEVIMAKDPAFLFYPGDYLRDTQMLSEKTQVAYDRIMCEHMRNICITQQQLKFITKRLSEEELSELMMMLSKINGGYQIVWVAESISKRKAYSESRRQNRESKPNKTSKTYDAHMENENEIINEVKKGKCLMKNSGVTIKDVSEAFKKSNDIMFAESQYYFNAALDWSDSGSNMRTDWIATIRGFARRDLKDGKLRMIKKERFQIEAAPEGFGEFSENTTHMPQSIKDKFGIK